MFSDFFKGISSYGQSLTLISELRLWKYVLLPGLVGIGLGFLIAGSAWAFYDDLAIFLLSLLPEFISKYLTAVSNVISALLILIAGFIVYKNLLMVAVSPFMGPLAQKVEDHLGNPTSSSGKFPPAQVLRDLIRGLRIAFRNILREILFSIPLLILSFIPVIGLAGVVGLFMVQAYYAGFGNIDYTLERHFTVKQSVRFVRKNRWLAVGNGTVFLLLLSTGIGVFFAPPLATIAATLETVKRLDGTLIKPMKTEYV